jgi:hypothetical protein
MSVQKYGGEITENIGSCEYIIVSKAISAATIRDIIENPGRTFQPVVYDKWIIECEKNLELVDHLPAEFLDTKLKGVAQLLTATPTLPQAMGSISSNLDGKPLLVSPADSVHHRDNGQSPQTDQPIAQEAPQELITPAPVPGSSRPKVPFRLWSKEEYEYLAECILNRLDNEPQVTIDKRFCERVT